MAPISYLFIGIAAFIVGFTKTSVGGVGILAVLLMALAVPGPSSPGVLLPMLIMADIMAVIYFRRSCQWNLLLRLAPAALIGVALTYWLLSISSGFDYNRFIGWVILAMLVIDILVSDSLRRHVRGNLITGIAGVLAGASSMAANAAAPVFGIYMLQMDLNKSEFVGTRSWFFLLLNLAKVPFALALGTITTQSLTLNLYYLPIILVGAYLGKLFVQFINLSVFKALIRLAALAAATRLIFG